MFEKLKSAFATATKNLSERELKTQDVDSAISDLEFALMDADVAVEAVEIIKSNLRESMVGISVEKKHISEHIQKGLASTVSKMFENAGSKDLVENIEKKRDESAGPYLVLFVGINGTGKTTTGYMLPTEKKSVVDVCYLIHLKILVCLHASCCINEYTVHLVRFCIQYCIACNCCRI